MTWYRLTKDIQLTYNFYGRSPDQTIVTYSKGSYVNTLKRKQYSSITDYTETEYIPEDAVEKVDFDPTDSIYFDERGDEYYADPGKYIEGVGWEFANLEDRIKTGNKIYSFDNE